MTVTEALVTNDNGDGTYSVNIPILNSTFDAPVCYSAGLVPIILKGAVVYVSFLNKDYGTPVIVGVKSVKGNIPTSDASFNSLSVNGQTVLGTDTTIGEVTYANLSSIKGCTEDVATKLQNIQTELSKIDLTNLGPLAKVVLTSEMYGTEDAMNNIKNPEDGRLFFVVSEGD